MTPKDDEPFFDEVITEFHWHEVLDRMHMIDVIFDEFIVDHPAVFGDEELYAKVKKIQDDLASLYQEIGNRRYPDDPEGEEDEDVPV